LEFMHIVEAWGTGIPRIINRCNEYGLPEPVFEEFGNGFKVVLFKKVSNAPKKVNNALEKVSNAPKKVSNTFEDYIPLLNAVGATDIYINNIRIVYEHCRVDTLFGQTNVMEWLNCSKSKATNVMNVLKMANAIKKVKGFGPGKYRFLDLKD
jgi:ATP-dependent DNA helicase RecG